MEDAPTEVLISEAKQHRRKRNLISALAVTLVAILAGGIWVAVHRPGSAEPPHLVGGSQALLSGLEDRSPSLFLAVRGLVTQPLVPPSTYWVAASSTKDGTLVRKLLPLSWEGMKVQDIALDRHGGLWVSYAKGADCRSHPIPNSHGPYDCNPIADTCRSFVARYDLATGASAVMYQGPSSEELGGAAASPDGRLLAYLTSGCTTSNTMSPAVRVQDIATGRTWTVRQASNRCGYFSLPTWGLSSQDLLFTTDDARVISPPTSRSSGCDDTSWWLTKVGALSGQHSDAILVHAGSGCSYGSVAPQVDGTFYAIDACGGLGSGFITGGVYLAHLDASLQPIGRLRLARCSDGSGTATSGSGAVLISAYTYCGGNGGVPQTSIWRVVDGRVTAPVTTNGNTWWDESPLAW